MIVRNWHIGKVASLRDAGEVLIISHRTALRLYGVIKIKPLRGLFVHPAGVCTRLRGFFMANADNLLSNWSNLFDIYGNSRTFTF